MSASKDEVAGEVTGSPARGERAPTDENVRQAFERIYEQAEASVEDADAQIESTEGGFYSLLGDASTVRRALKTGAARGEAPPTVAHFRLMAKLIDWNQRYSHPTMTETRLNELHTITLEALEALRLAAHRTRRRFLKGAKT